MLHAFSRAPIAGARIAAWDTDAPMEFPAVRETDEEGRFVVTGAPAEPAAGIVASAAGFAPVRLQHTVTEPVRDIEILVGGGGILGGRVVGADGRPVAGRPAYLVEAGAPVPLVDEGRGGGVATLSSSQDGKVVRDVASHGSVSLPNVVPGRKPLRIVLPKGALLSGRIVGPRAGTEVQTRYISDALGGGQSFKLPADGAFRHGSTRAGERFVP